MRVALLGPPQSGKSKLFAAVAEAGGADVDTSRPDKAHLAVVKATDERLGWLAEQHKPKKVTPAELEFLDLPGFNLSDEPGRGRAKTHWPAMRQSDMLVFVVRAFEAAAVPAYRGRVDPAADVEELLAEMLFADLDQVTTRIEKLSAAILKPTAQRDLQKHELELMNRLSETLQADKPLAEAATSDTEAKLLRSFAFLSQKPVLVVLNCSESAVDAAGAHAGEILPVGTPAGPSKIGTLPCLRLSAKIEEELAQLPAEERAEFLADMHLEAVARDVLVRACYESLKLVSFYTVNPNECRAWAVPEGTDALRAAGLIHSDIARGFIRAETVAYENLRAAGDMKAARAAGKVRLEGKTYLIHDGDVIYFRFNV